MRLLWVSLVLGTVSASPLFSEDESWKIAIPGDRLASDQVLSVAVDKNNVTWIGTADGVSRIEALMGGKKIKGRKRHVATDTLGNMLTVQVHAAHIADTSQGWEVCDRVVEKYDLVEAFSGDRGYRGTTVEFVENLLGLRLDIASKPPQGFQVVPKRWIIKRTFAWLGGFRRWAKDFEILTHSAENMIRIAMIKITVAKCV